ncbi:MAG: ABC transporter ATP-binding protein [Clostridia bacterium]|nr:ABC transporter ATP-binding protein [Clostridia bacterium]
MKEKRFIDYVMPNIPIMMLGLLIKFIGTISELFLPSILSYMIDDIAPTGDVGMMFIFGGVMIAASFIVLIANIVANRMASKVSSKITRKLRHDSFEKTLHLSCEQMDRITAPTLVSRLTSDTYNVNQMLISVQRIGVRAPILVIGGVVVTLFLDRALTVVLLAIMPIVFAIIFFISRRGIRLYTEVQHSADRLVLGMQENLNGIRVIKALSKTEYENEKFGSINNELMQNDIRAGRNNALSGPILQLFLNYGLTAVIIYGAIRVSLDLSRPGAIIAFLSYFTIILNALMMVNRVFMQLSKGLASVRRINELLAEDTTDISEKISAESEKEAVILHENGEKTAASEYRIVFDGVSFSYLKVKDNVENISFALRPGETLGIIGATGSGKTTVISLLLRFYQPDSGRILIDGVDISSIPPSELYKRIGVALQSDFLMADTIRENIAFGREMTDGEITYAAENAMAAEFIAEKPGGINEFLNVKGANVSGGQKQRILISRALAGKPDILILDDSSGGLDYRTDALLRQNLATAYADVTRVIVAQRVSSIMNANIIMVLDEGRVIGFGTHAELMESCPDYRHIAETQMGSKQ